MNAFDPRLTPARPDLASARLAGTVEAARFVEGTRHAIAWPVAPDEGAALAGRPAGDRGAVRRER